MVELDEKPRPSRLGRVVGGIKTHGPERNE